MSCAVYLDGPSPTLPLLVRLRPVLRPQGPSFDDLVASPTALASFEASLCAAVTDALPFPATCRVASLRRGASKDSSIKGLL